ncbi:MAG: hypothetical protein K9J16_00720 [Melioribacteraceae bacterium]|nr:hypothetical protein [Melioribacteraceae bacterium]MCF8356745.1 hypothetical protein [Melioribacteraceae bacterium]MCF8395968.1 hypothetical protein [Melioribacteraceae bacterium]MCF8419531.1 hypothetical protein [Melioribacteraceae bacterium]
MARRQRISSIYLIIVVVVFFFVHEKYGNDLHQSILVFATIDVIIAIFAILKGLFQGKMWAVAGGAICGIIAYQATKNISYISLLFQVLGGLVGVNAAITKSLKKVLDKNEE